MSEDKDISSQDPGSQYDYDCYCEQLDAMRRSKNKEAAQ